MPTVLRSGPYRLFFDSGDRNEPPHVHIERDAQITKCGLQAHCVNSEIKLRGEDGEIYGIDCAQMDDVDWIVICRETVLLT